MAFLKDLKVKLGLDNSKFKSGLSESERRTKKFGGSIKKIGGLIAGAFAVGKIVEFGKELIKLGGEAQGVRAAFEKIGGATVMSDLRKAVKGTVSDLDLMKQAVQANNFDIPLQNLAGLFEFARRRAKATGESVDYLTQSIVTGIGRKSPLILDNLGISASQLREELNGASVASSSIGSVTAAVERIASRALKGMAKDSVTATEKMANLSAGWTNFKTRLGEALAENDLFNRILNKSIAIIENLGKSEPEKRFEGIKKWIGEANTNLEKYNRIQKEIIITQDALLTAKEKGNKDDIDYYTEYLALLQKESGLIKTQIDNQNKLATAKAKSRAAGLTTPFSGAPLVGGVSTGLGEGKIDVSQFSIPDELNETYQAFLDFNQRMDDLANDFLNSAVAGFSDGMQTLTDSIIAGGDIDAGAIVSALLTPLADMAIRTGEVAVATGIGVEAIRKSLETLSGISAIAAGVSLIAVGSAAKSALKAAARGGGGTSSRNAGSGLQATPVTGGSSIIQSGEAVAGMSGDKGIIEELGNVKFRIEGSDLVGVFDRENKTRGAY